MLRSPKAGSGPADRVLPVPKLRQVTPQFRGLMNLD